jgi:anti-sigma regulatory factor (Ser/Thr protein kinase)
MDTPARRRRTSGMAQRATILGSVTVPGCPEEVSRTRAFVARVLARVPDVDSDAATLLTSELVTNAIQHTASGTAGGTVTVVVIGIPGGAGVEVIDDGSAGAPTVKDDVYTTEGHGLFLVQRLATRWGYLQAPEGTTVWFHLAADGPADERGAEDRYPAPAAATAASAAATTPAQMAATSSSPVTYGGIV